MASPIQPSERNSKSTAARPALIKGFRIPSNAQEWSELAHNAGLRSHTIHTIPANFFASGSHATQQQYIALRMISPPIKPWNSLASKCQKYGITSSMIQKAKETLSSSKEWPKYLKIIRAAQSMDLLTEGDNEWPGSFSVPRHLQQQIVTVDGVHDNFRLAQPARQVESTRAHEYNSREENLPDAEDEIVPNAAAITLFSQLLQMTPCNIEWVLNRAYFKAEFKFGNFSAQTDGILRQKSQPKPMIFGILEAKSRVRRIRTEAILMQESCEIVAWLMSQTSKVAIFDHHFLLLSQDRHELYITFALCTDEYEKYIGGDDSPCDPMTLQTYGPWNTEVAEEMEDFAIWVLVTALRARRFLDTGK